MNNKEFESIKNKIHMFTQMVESQGGPGTPLNQERDNPQKRRSGLYGLSVIAVTLYSKRHTDYMDKILYPVINSFNDKDSKVLLAACDAMYNIVMICKESILRQKRFLEIFDHVIGLISSSHDNNVKDHSKKVDDLLKDTVYRSLDRGLMFDLDQLINAICENLIKA